MVRRVSLTFDNGPTPGVTERVLAILADAGARVTFFVIGDKVATSDAHRRLLDDVAAAGHWIGNHTYSHRGLMASLPGPDVADREIVHTQALIAPYAHPDRFYRPCGGGGQLVPGLLTAAAVDVLTRGGFTLVLWNCVPRDWSDAEGWPERAMEMIEALPNGADDWPLVVLHDVDGAALKRLVAFLAMLSRAGLEITQALPPAAMPIRRGRIVGDLSAYLA